MTNFKRYLTLFLFALFTAFSVHVWGVDYEYQMVTSLDGVTAGTYVVGALRSTSATNNFYFGKAEVSSGDWVVSDSYVTVAESGGVRKFDATNLPTGAVEFTFTGNNTDGFTIANGSNYLYFTTNSNRKLAFAAAGSTYKWAAALKDGALITGGMYLSKKAGGTGDYTISENSTATGAIRGYANTTAYRAIYLFKKQEKSGGGSNITVAYDANGGSGTMTSQTGSTSYTVKTNSFTAPTGGTFTGWNTAADGSGTAYAAGNTISSNATLYAQWKYKVRFYTASGTYTDITETTAHAGVTPPVMQATCGSYTFQGWSTTERASEVTTSTALVTLTDGKYYPTAATTLYPVYSKVGGGGASLTKMTSGSTVANGDQLVIVAKVGDDYYGCLQEELSGSYVNYWTQASEPTASNIDDAKKYFTVSTATGGWYLGDATNGFLYNASSNNLTCPTGDKSIWTIEWDGTESKFTIKANTRYLSCRSDLTGSNQYKYRMGGTGTGTGTAFFDIYKYAGGTVYYYSYPTCLVCANPILTFDNSTVTKNVGDANFINTLTVTGNNLPSTVSYDSNLKSKATIASDGTVTILQSTEEGTPVTITATRLAADNGVKCDNEVVQTYTLNIKNKIRWFANEVEITSGSQTTEVFYNGTITTLPANPSVPTACSSKQFIGWTDVAEWDDDAAPDHLYKTAGEFPTIREDKTFYAVFANVTPGDPISTLTQTLQYDTWTYSGTTKDMSTYRLFGEDAYIESASFDRSELSEIHVYGGTYGGSSYSDISIMSGSTEWATESFTSTSSTKEYTLSSSTTLSGTGTIKVVSNSGNGSTTGVRISKVEIYTMVDQDVATGYVTKCCTEWSDPTLTYNKLSIAVGESDATKSLSGTTHGDLSFESNNTAVATVDPSTGAVHAVSPGSATIIAHWTKSGGYCAKDMYFTFTITGDVTVSFDANGGTGSMANQTGIPYNTATALNTMSGLTAPTGKTFIGWNTQADGKGTSYANGASIKLTTNTTLYAQWGTAYTITLHRGGSTENVTVLSTDFPYTLPTSESDYCDAWQFDGWSTTAVANNSVSYTRVTKATTAEDADFYAVYKGDQYSAEAYVRISEASEVEANKQYIFVAYLAGKKHVMTNNFSRADYDYGEMTTVEIAESGKDYYLKSVIDTEHPQCRWKIFGSTGAWTIFNMSSSSYCINLNFASSKNWYTTTTTSNSYKITPNYLFWTVESNASVTYKYFYASKQGNESDHNVRYVFQTSKNHSGALQLYKLGTTDAYKYTSTPSGEGCSVECTNSGAQFTYPEMEKSISSANFNNTVIYTLATNTATRTYTSSKTSVATVNATTGEVHVEGIGTTTITMTQGRDNTDPSHPICGVTLSYELTVTSPSLEVVEVTADDKIIVEHDFNGITNASIDSSKYKINGQIADDIFISKYYEAASEMKLIGLYNGTEHDIDLSQLRIRTNGGTGGTVWGGTSNHGEAYLGQIPQLGIDHPDFLLPPFTEIVLWSNSESGDNNGGNAQLCYCVNMTIDGKTYNYDDMVAGKVPNWYRVGTTSGGTDIYGNKTFNFNGDDQIILERSTDGSSWTAIDLFGSGTPAAPVPVAKGNGTASDNGKKYKFSKLNDNPDDGSYYWIHLDGSDNPIDTLSTNRFYLTRLQSVKSGFNAVESNGTIFATLGTEWKGKGIGGGTNMEDYCGSGELFSEVATYDYAKYYTDYEKINEGWTADDNGDGTLTIQFGTGKLAELACKKIKISVTNASDLTKKAEVEYRVPIIVKTSADVTQSPLFNSHDKDECKVCDVAILNGAVLTKSKPTSPAEVAADRDQVYNIDVYAGGELYVPNGTDFKVNTLTVRSKGDEVGLVDVQGKLTRNNSTLIHSKRFHNVGADWRWYFFSLPYDCNVSEVTFSNGDPAVHGADFEIDWYDGEHRASSQANGNWVSIASHPDYPNVIKAGYGYTIAVEGKAGHDNVSLHFPMANFKEVSTQVVVPVGNWGAGDDAVEVNHKGWNVVGNPYLNMYKAQAGLDINGALRVGYLEVQSGKWVQDAEGARNINYATIPLDGGKSGYDQQALTNHEFNPFQSFIIQVGGDAPRSDLQILLKNAYKKKRASIVMRKDSEYEAEENAPVWLPLNISNSDGEKDQTTIIISDNYTDEYDMTYDLAKWRGSSYKRYTKPVIASVYGGYELAFNALSDESAANIIPLTVFTKNSGEMTFELSRGQGSGALEEVILHDSKLNVNHNLLTNGKYQVYVNAGETSDRFSLSARVNRKKEPQIATDIFITDAPDGAVRKLLIDGNIYIQRGNKIYDITGKPVVLQ